MANLQPERNGALFGVARVVRPKYLRDDIVREAFRCCSLNAFDLAAVLRTEVPVIHFAAGDTRMRADRRFFPALRSDYPPPLRKLFHRLFYTHVMRRCPFSMKGAVVA